jgi:hypothetical protein
VIRRLPIICVAVVAAVTAAGCGTFSNNDAVAEVDGDELTRDQLGDFVATPGAEDAATGTVPTTGGDEAATAPGDASRQAIYIWVLDRLLSGELARNGGEVTDEDRADVEEALSANPSFTSESELFQQTLINAQATFRAWGEQLSEASNLQEQYEEGPQASGFTCAAHILVATEEEARDVLTQLESGSQFAEIAQSASTDTGSGQAGGALGCTSTETFQSQFVPEFVAGALDAEVGVPTEPVQSEFGWHVIQLQPYEEIADQFQQFNADAELSTLIENADVFVDPRYGEFTPAAVIPLGAPSTPSSSVG